MPRFIRVAIIWYYHYFRIKIHIPEGTIVAMLTPFDKDGKINETKVRKSIEFLISKGVDGIFPVSSCGDYVHGNS